MLSIYCILMGACNLFEVRKTGGDVAITDTILTIDSAAALSGPTLHMDSTQVRDLHVADRTQNKDTVLLPPAKEINTGAVLPDTVVRFAETLIGTPYVYASTNPAVGFDCSGFITYVFNHFNIRVPRSSVDFTNVGKSVPVTEARRGDLILFTGTDSTERTVGHMGLITANTNNELQFIHSSSGKAKGVTITPLNNYYRSRFVKVIRIFL
jgi:cell wall-associated NlpC family hydrolase